MGLGISPRQPDEQIGDLLVLLVQFGAVSIAGLTDIESANAMLTPCGATAFPAISGVEMAASFFPEPL